MKGKLIASVTSYEYVIFDSSVSDDIGIKIYNY